MNEPAIAATGISKSFGPIKALDNVSLTVRRNEIYGLIGPDGAGKTTLFRILTTLMRPDSGSATVCGADIAGNFRHIRKITGYMPGRFSLYPDLSVDENINFFASLFGGKANENSAAIEPIYRQLAAFRHRRAANLSGGMKQKLALCCALIHKPEILVLDEPTTGVDAVSRDEFWEILTAIRSAEGITVIISTPYMNEAARCDRLALMNAGKILESGTLDEILSRNRMPLLAISGPDNYSLLLQMRKIDGIADAFLCGKDIHAFTDSRLSAEQLRTTLGNVDIKPIAPDLEDVFIKLMSHD